MDTDNGTTIADTSLTGPNITRLFLEAASNLSSNYSLDTNDTMLLEILVSTDSTYTTSMWTALLSTDLQLVSASDTTSSVPTNASISSPVTPSSPHSTMLSSASELEQSSSRSDHVQESLHTIMESFGASSSPGGETSETSSSTFAESGLSVSLSSFSPLASTMTIGLSMSDIVAPDGKETSYVALESKETLSLPLQATVTRSYSSSGLEGYLIQATSTLPHNYTTSVLTEKSPSPELGETVFQFSSLSSTASMPLEYSRGVSTAAGFSQDHFSSEVSQKYVLLSSPQDTLAQEFQKTPALSASNVFLEATSFDLELMLMPSSSSSPLASTGGILGIVSSASRGTTLELKSEAMSSMLLQRELSLSSITHSGASTEVLLSTGAPSMALQSAFTQELETTVRSSFECYSSSTYFYFLY
ncbi:hyphal wall protein 2-like [Pomacea canaliculata]|nr:hyphal wall protein 2-like [Pomacea canaliculata]